MKQNYVPTSLDQYLNENKSITLTRQYGDKEAVVVGSRAPLRNQVLSYVLENKKVTRTELKKFIAGLNEGNQKPAATNMWLKRNGKFFITESKGGVTTYKLSKLGEKLVKTLRPTPVVGSLSEKKKDKADDKAAKWISKPGFKKYGKESKGEEKIEEEDEEVEETCHEETREDRINKLVEQIRAKRAKTVNEEVDESVTGMENFEKKRDAEAGDSPANLTEDEEEDEIIDDAEEDADAEVEDAEEEVSDEVEDEESTEEVEDEVEDEEVMDDDRVEVSEFIITVEDVAAALEELGELGIEASEVGMEADVDSGDEMDDLGEVPAEDDLEDEEPVEDEMDDFDLDLGGDFEGEEEVEESVTGMEQQEDEMWPNLTEDDDEDELAMDDVEELPVEVDADGNEEVEGEEEDLGEVPAEDEVEDLGEVPAEDEVEVGGESQIRVPAEYAKELLAWLEEKGVDTEEMFGGTLEFEGDEGDEDEISFDGLEDIEETPEDESEEHEAEETPEEEAEEEAEGDDDEKEDEEVEESVTGMENFEKKRNKEAGDKPANVTKTKGDAKKKVNEYGSVSLGGYNTPDDQGETLESIASELKDDGYDVNIYFQETHAGIDHDAIVGGGNDAYHLAYMEPGQIESIGGSSEDWGWCVIDNMAGDLQSFGDDEDSASIFKAMDAFKQLMDKR